MKRDGLQSLTIEQLVARFVELAKQESDALQSFRSTNRIYPKQLAVSAELRSRGVEARRALLPLLNFPSAWSPPPMLDPQAAIVRLNAACELLAVEPERARAALEALAAKGPTEAQFRAKLTLSRLDDGTFKPS